MSSKKTPYARWVGASAGLNRIDDASPEQLETLLESLAAICADLDEHGEANLHLYGNGSVSMAHFFASRDEAKRVARERRTAGAGPAETSTTGPASVTLSAPVAIGEFTSHRAPLAVGDGFLSSTPGQPLVVRDRTGSVVRVIEAIDSGLRFDTNQTRVAVVSHQTTVRITDSSVECATEQLRVNRLAFSPEGDRLAVAHETGVAVFSCSTGNTLAQVSLDTRHSFEPIEALDWSPDGTTLCVIASLWVEEDVRAVKTLLVFDSATLTIKLSEAIEVSTKKLLRLFTARRALISPSGPTSGLLGVVDLERATVTPPIKLSKHKRAQVREVCLNSAKTLAAVTFLPRHDRDAYSLSLVRLAPLEVLATLELPDPKDGLVAFTADDAALIVVGKTKTWRIDARATP